LPQTKLIKQTQIRRVILY